MTNKATSKDKARKALDPAYLLNMTVRQRARLRLLSLVDNSVRSARCSAAVSVFFRNRFGVALRDDERRLLASDEPYMQAVIKYYSLPVVQAELERFAEHREHVLDFFHTGTEEVSAYLDVAIDFAKEFPELDGYLDRSQVDRAVRAWAREPGTKRKSTHEPLKWDAAADLVNAAGLGPVSGPTLEQEWSKWVRHAAYYYGPKLKPRELKEPEWQLREPFASMPLEILQAIVHSPICTSLYHIEVNAGMWAHIEALGAASDKG